MTDFDENNQASIAEFVRAGLKRHDIFSLGTLDENGHPWVVCLNIAYDDKLNIIWKSNKATEHSKHLQKNAHVSVGVFSHTTEFGDFGFYSKGVAHEVTDPAELAHCIDVRYTQAGKDAPALSEFQGESEYRLYIAELEEAWVVGKRHIKVKIDLQLFRNAILSA